MVVRFIFNWRSLWHRLSLYAALAVLLASCQHAKAADPTLTPDELGWVACVEQSDYTDTALELCDARWGEHDMRVIKARQAGSLTQPITTEDDGNDG